MFELLRLLLDTIQLRPYVFVFLLVYIAAGAAHLGWRRTFLFLPVGYAIAWASEFSSIHWGFPYGDYYYIPETVGRELWVYGVPFMDSLSYVFLAYCSYATALFILSPLSFAGGRILILETRALRRSTRTLLLAAFLFVFLDIIIDPVALQGHRWFLGQIYGYRHEGLYFGIPMSNFGGWLLVGLVMVSVLQRLDYLDVLESKSLRFYHRLPGVTLLGPLLYLSILLFNLTITFWIGERLLGLVGSLWTLLLVLFTVLHTRRQYERLTPEHVEQHMRDFPLSH